MTSAELKTAYADIFGYMANSRDPENMKAFGKVMTEMYMWLADNKPEMAEEWLNKLEAIRWEQYLTPKEAEAIVSKMQPRAPWSREAWMQAMNKLGLPVEEQPFYNRCALFVEMNKQYSDHGDSVAALLDQPLASIPADIIVPAMHSMALDLLKDEDEVYDIRSYFSL